MNAHTSIQSEATSPSGSPADLEIRIRDERFNRNTSTNRWWAGDAFGTAWHNALSATFPRGEAFFIEAVKAHRPSPESANPSWKQKSALSCGRKSTARVNTSRSTAASDAGYDIAKIDDRVRDLLELTKGRPPLPTSRSRWFWNIIPP